jgi:hypothetical protein
MARVMRTLHVNLYPRADCRGTAQGDAESNCGRTWPPHLTTLSRVKDHVKHTGHAVLVTRETRSLYEVA